MPLYFFNVHDGRSILDEEGTELPDLASVRKEAVRFSGNLLAEDQGEFWKGKKWRLDVTDVTGLVLFSLSFQAVEISAAPEQALSQTQPEALI